MLKDMPMIAVRCQEILDWKRTGKLVDGELRKLAASLKHIPDNYRLDIAEKETADQAMQYVANRFR